MKSESTSALSRLFRYAKEYRSDLYLATFYSILNKFFDILPEFGPATRQCAGCRYRRGGIP